MPKALQKADDSNGAIGGTIDYAFEYLIRVFKEISETDRTVKNFDRAEWFRYSLQQSKKSIYTDFSWEWEWYKVAGFCVADHTQFEILTATMGANSKYGYQKDFQTEISYGVISRLENSDSALEYVKANLESLFCIDVYVDWLTDRNKLVEAEELVAPFLDGFRGEVATKMRKKAAQIHKKMGDTHKLIDDYRALLFLTGEKQYGEMIKSMCTNKEWDEFLLSLKPDKHFWGGFHYTIIFDLYIERGWYDQVLDIIKKEEMFSYIDSYRAILESNCPDEMAQIYEMKINNLMSPKYGLNRKIYQKVAQTLRRIKKLGYTKKVEELIAKLKKAHSKSTALKEELDLV